jgi:hypothetical protein
MAVTVLGLAAAMIANQVYGTPPVTTRYSTFTGGFGMIVAGVGVVCTFVSVPELVPIVVDILGALFFLGGGIVRSYLFFILSSLPHHQPTTLFFPPSLSLPPQHPASPRVHTSNLNQR